MKGISYRGNHICFGKYALQALEPAWITSRQIEAGRRAMTRNARRGGKIWVRIFPDKPVTIRPAETRMGSGKGSPEYWVAVVKTGRILYEMGGTHLNVADNSGARKLMCIRIIGASNRRYAHIGDVIVAVIKEAVPNMPLEKSEVVRAVIGALPEMKEQKWIHEGLITESLPNGMFRVRLDNEDLIIGYVSGKIRRSFIRILPGDKVKIEVSRYDSTKGRIIYRLRNKDSKD
ncbi:hypothetical protein RDWZM_010630 [Blomia tropicalis]|uniref:Large ribosomal subunit protein uL16m n=3 Tax=Eukaryota TaxID=2759 RepID=A0A9Q0M0T3_BLOTA|nr:hypothetical protein RDWZM_010630 [Blomia tropicalis]